MNNALTISGLMKPFVKIYLKKQQEQFVLDLKKALK